MEDKITVSQLLIVSTWVNPPKMSKDSMYRFITENLNFSKSFPKIALEFVSNDPNVTLGITGFNHLFGFNTKENITKAIECFEKLLQYPFIQTLMYILMQIPYSYNNYFHKQGFLPRYYRELYEGKVSYEYALLYEYYIQNRKLTTEIAETRYEKTIYASTTKSYDELKKIYERVQDDFRVLNNNYQKMRQERESLIHQNNSLQIDIKQRDNTINDLRQKLNRANDELTNLDKQTMSLTATDRENGKLIKALKATIQEQTIAIQNLEKNKDG